MKLLFQKINKRYVFTFFFFLTFVFLFLYLQVVSADQTTQSSVERQVSDGVNNVMSNFWISIVSWVENLSRNMFSVSATVFDNLLMISLNSKLLDQDFIKFIWVTLRDLVNSVLFLGAIFLALMYMFDRKGVNRAIIMLIVAIFALNFSLFASRVIVDAGNLTATVFMSPISVKIESAGDNDFGAQNYFGIAKSVYGKFDEYSVGDGDFSAVALGVGGHIDPRQKILSSLQEMFKGAVTKTDKDGLSINSGDLAKGKHIGTFSVVFLIASAIYIIFAIEFFKASFMFIARLVRLMVIMATSPLWFAAMFIPDRGFGYFRNMWLLPIIQTSFCIAVYMIFIWFTVVILSSPNLNLDLDNLKYGADEEAKALIAWILSISLKAVFAYVLLRMARQRGHDMCEGSWFGQNGLFGMLAKPAGAVAGAAFGAARMVVNPFGTMGRAAVRTAVGRTGAGIGNSEVLKNRYSKGGFRGYLAGRSMAMGDKLASMKIGKKSYRDDMNIRMKEETEFDKRLTDEQRDRRQRGALKKIDTKTVRSIVDPEKNTKYQELIEKTKDQTLSKEVRDRAEKEAEVLLNGGYVASQTYESVNEENKKIVTNINSTEVQKVKAQKSIDEYNEYVESRNKISGVEKDGKEVTLDQRKEAEDKKNELEQKKVDGTITEKEIVELDRNERTIKDFNDQQEDKKIVESYEANHNIESINKEAEEKYEEKLKIANSKEGEVVDGKLVDKQDIESAKVETRKMVADGKIKEFSKTKVSDMDIDMDEAQGLQLLGASLIPALAAKRNRLRENNEASVTKIRENTKIEAKKSLIHESAVRKAEKDAIIIDDSNQKIDILSGDVMKRIDEWNGKKLTDLEVSGDFNKDEIDQIEKLQQINQETLKTIKAEYDRKNKYDKAETEYRKKLNKQENQYSNSKKEEAELGEIRDRVNSGGLSSSDIEKIKKIGGDQYEKNRSNIENTISNLEKTISDVNPQDTGEINKINEQINTQKKKLSEAMVDVIANQQTMVKDSIKDQEVNLQTTKDSLKSAMDDSKKATVSYNKKVKQIMDKEKNKMLAINKADFDQEAAMINQQIAQGENVKRKVEVNAAQNADILTTTSSDDETGTQ